ncbi:MAG: OmpA family protein [Ignavibacteriaceae bacterium]
MKLFTYVLLILLGFAQFSIAQDAVETPKNNSMSNAFGVTAEGGVTLSFTDYDALKMDYIWKGSLEYYLPSTGNGNFGLRIFGQTGFIAGEDAPLGALNPTNEFSTKIDMYGGGVIYILSVADAIYPWLAVGVSNLWFYPEDGNGNKLPNNLAGNYYNHMLAYNGDVGLRFMASKNLSINIAGGIILGSEDFLDDIEANDSNDKLYTATAGLTFYFGRDTDADKDGVPDSRDACPNTPVEAKVGEDGCPLDADNDGVPDYLDKCPETSAGVRVDAHGCPLDSDGDGVSDDLDKCPDTPAGVKVDANGCPPDADGDGVPDYLDKCSNTPAKVSVDEAGCPLDADGDGVPDYLDKCPGTPKDTQVDAEGCSTVDTVVVSEIKSLVLSGDTNFEFNKSALLPNAYAALDGIVNTMKENPEYTWEVGGHTDGIGSASYNKRLSEQRAQSVVDYLANKGVNRNNLRIVGYGKDSPIATNDTPEGRSMNRRVEIKLLSQK